MVKDINNVYIYPVYNAGQSEYQIENFTLEKVTGHEHKKGVRNAILAHLQL